MQGAGWERVSRPSPDSNFQFNRSSGSKITQNYSHAGRLNASHSSQDLNNGCQPLIRIEYSLSLSGTYSGLRAERSIQTLGYLFPLSMTNVPRAPALRPTSIDCCCIAIITRGASPAGLRSTLKDGRTPGSADQFHFSPLYGPRRRQSPRRNNNESGGWHARHSISKWTPSANFKRTVLDSITHKESRVSEMR